MDRACFFHYNNAIDAMDKGSVVAINSIWLFIKSLINAAYGETYSEDSNVNVDLINENICDKKLCDRLHEIRKERNSYEHETVTTCTQEQIKRWHETLQLLIKHVNSTSKTGYQFKLKRSDAISTKTTNEIIRTDDSSIKNDTSQENQQYIKPRRTRNTDTYYVAYGDSEKSFSIMGKFDFDNKYPVFSVVHNLLTRGKTIAESEFIKSKRLSARKLEIVYILEIVIIRAICEDLCKDGVIYISDEHKELAKIALEDIKYLCYLVENMSNQRVDFPAVKFVSFANEFEAGRPEPNTERNIVAKVLSDESSSFYMPKLFSSHIEYRISPQNIKFYCTILKLLFGYDEFREGQLASLESIFNSKENHMIILPTGYGKSLIYQFYAFIQPQVTVVVSPTNCLIYDQLINLKTYGLTESAQLDKHITVRNYSYQLLSNLVYTTPDVLESENVFSLISGLHKRNLLNTIAIDESHQVSIWGHCFDANYFTLLHQIKNEFAGAKILLFSATASQRIKEDLEQQIKPFALKVLQPCPLVREHIHYDFRDFNSTDEIFEDIKCLYENSFGTGNEYDLSPSLETPNLTLIICNNYLFLTQLYNTLCKSEITIDECMLYKGEKRKYNSFRLAHQKIMLTDDTNLAGINIPFLKNVLIIGFPPSKEWFYQECGRIGRNGEKSNVIVYCTKSNFETNVKKIPTQILKENKGGLFEQNKKNINFSNAEFIDSFLVNKADSEMAFQLLNEIYKYIHVKNDASLGTVIGRMGEGEREKYDRALFLLYYCGIIEKWLFSDDETYRFYINMNIDDGAVYFIEKTKTKIKAQSGNDEVLKYYLSQLSNCEEFFSLFLEIANWISENGYLIRRQMFINTIQLMFEAGELKDKDIEQNLAFYFSIGYTRCNVVKQKVSFDVLKTFKEQEIQTINYDEEEETLSTIDTTILENGKNVVKNESDADKISITNTNDGIIPLKEISQSKTLANEEDEMLTDIADSKIEKSNFEESQMASLIGTESHDLLISWLKNISKQESLLDVEFRNIITKLEESNVEEIAFMKGFIEREIEYKYNKNMLIVLSLIELIKDNRQSVYRTQMILECMTEPEIYLYFEMLSKKLTIFQKNNVDDMLIRNGKNKIYYKGIIGFVKKIFKL